MMVEPYPARGHKLSTRVSTTLAHALADACHLPDDHEDMSVNSGVDLVMHMLDTSPKPSPSNSHPPPQVSAIITAWKKNMKNKKKRKSSIIPSVSHDHTSKPQQLETPHKSFATRRPRYAHSCRCHDTPCHCISRSIPSPSTPTPYPPGHATSTSTSTHPTRASYPAATSSSAGAASAAASTAGTGSPHGYKRSRCGSSPQSSSSASSHTQSHASPAAHVRASSCSSPLGSSSVKTRGTRKDHLGMDGNDGHDRISLLGWSIAEDRIIAHVFTGVRPEMQRRELARLLPKRSWHETRVRFRTLCMSSFSGKGVASGRQRTLKTKCWSSKLGLTLHK